MNNQSLLAKKKALEDQLNEVNDLLSQSALKEKSFAFNFITDAEFNRIRSKMEKLNKGLRETKKFNIEVEVESYVGLGDYEIEEKFDQTIDLDGMSTDYKVTVVKCSSKDFSTQDLRYIKSDIQGYFDQGDYIFENFDVHKNSNIKNKYNKELNEIYDDINALAIKKDINEDELTDILCIYSSLDDARKHYRG
jgi:hypothetical protein